MEDQKIYVTSTWLNSGHPQGLIAKTVVVCDNWEQARKVMDGMDMDASCGYVNHHYKMPYYSPNKYSVSVKQYSDLPNGRWIPWIRK